MNFHLSLGYIVADCRYQGIQILTKPVRETLIFLQLFDCKNLFSNYQRLSQFFYSRDGSDTAITIHQDVKLYVSYLAPKKLLQYLIAENRMIWLQLIKGSIRVNDVLMEAGDGAGINEAEITILALQQAEFLLFDLAAS